MRYRIVPMLLALLCLLSVPAQAAEGSWTCDRDVEGRLAAWMEENGDRNCWADTPYGEQFPGAVRSGDFYWSHREDRYAAIVATAYDMLADLGGAEQPEVVYIPAEIDGHPVREIGECALSYVSHPVVLPEGMTVIRKCVAADLSGVHSITILF